MRSALLLVGLVLAFPLVVLAGDWSAPGKLGVESRTGSWTDGARAGRELPYRIYLPKASEKPCPVVILSHGLGGNRDGYIYLGEYFSSHGWGSVHLQHRGSDTDAIRQAIARGENPVEAMRKAAMDLRNAIDRPGDVSFAIDQLEKANAAGGELAGRLDLSRIGMTGHSFGAYTSMAIAGQSGGRASFRDERVSAAIAMSAPAPKGSGTYAKVDIPVLLMTGTLDDSPLLGGTPAQRIAAFEMLAIPDRYLLVLNGGDHMVFSGRRESFAGLRLPGMSGDRAQDGVFQAKIAAISMAFLEAYVSDDAEARGWLQQDSGAKADLGALGTWEFRPGSSK